MIDLNGAGALLSAAAGFLVALTGFLAVVLKLWRRDDRTDGRVDLVWEANFRRGMVEAVHKQILAEGQADVVIQADVRKAYEPVAAFLWQIKRQYPTHSDAQLGEQIELRLGGWLTKHICAVLVISNFACLAVAVLVANEAPAEAAPPAAKESAK